MHFIFFVKQDLIESIQSGFQKKVISYYVHSDEYHFLTLKTFYIPNNHIFYSYQHVSTFSLITGFAFSFKKKIAQLLPRTKLNFPKIAITVVIQIILHRHIYRLPL